MDSVCGLKKVVQIVACLQLLFAGGTEGTTATEAIRVPVVPGTTPCPYNEEEILTLDVRPRSAENRFSLFDSFSGCRLPPAPRNGFAVVRRNTNRLEFYCNRGFNITSTEPMRCLNVAWTWKPPRCLNGTELEDSPQDGIPLWRLARGSPCGNNYGDCAQLCIYGSQHYCCGCQSGYLANGTECIAVTCPPLTPPEHGYIVGSEIRTCQVNGTWSGVTSQCVVKRCGEPPTPVNGYVRDCQEDRAVGTSCTICCIEGYRLVGESTTVCTSSKTWTVAEPICNLVQCPSPASLTRTARLLEDGLNRTYVYKDTFWPRCPSGFRLRGPQLILCGANGHWEAVFGQSTLFNCVDNEEPVIRCPANITQSVRAGRRGAIVMWKQPEARDNSGVLPEIQQDPENIVSPWRFPIGQTAIRFRATDAARLSTECTFTVTVVRE
ncbi:sushi, von Willebrand factor type A, EGF and pentraxin domain-containing protein 1 isoform X2 [Ixodes scapularis]|uniref:sushi, von Willebrand factor type A, EGF and pentraxin domain-containing protein 1 isoform X2 n=1 Tax=Ixodes scapularis TaxID=6945 RepID=UPI001A9E7831|nr:sushi, von Willebrand factor type A, EGF and pentraxin domain-containing protein 1 isoform X2 [Ixodes scapularis]